MIDKLGTPDTYNHYPTGWAVAFSTPYRMFKRYTYQGGVCDPLVDPLARRDQGAGRGPPAVPPLDRHRPDDPRVLRRRDARGRQRRTSRRRSPGVSMRYSFDAADAPTHKQTQYYEMLGNARHLARGLEGGRRARPDAAASATSTNDRWQLFHTDEDRSEAHDLAEQHPEKVEELTALWFEEAKENNVLPLNDLIVGTEGLRDVHRDGVPASRCRRAAGTPTTRARPRSRSARRPTSHDVSYKVLAEVELTRRRRGRDLRPGLALRRPLAVRQGRHAHYAYNFLGIPPEHRISAPAPTPGRHIIGVEFTKERMGEHHERIGPLKLYIDDEVVAEQEIRT